MDKMTKAYGELFKQIIPESPLKEAFRKYNKSMKKLYGEQNEK